MVILECWHWPTLCHSCHIPYMPRIAALIHQYIPVSHSRSGSTDGCSVPHSLHSCDLLRINGSDCPHPSHDGGCYLGQHGGSEPAALPLWQHHPGQEATLLAWPWLEPVQVRGTSWNQFSLDVVGVGDAEVEIADSVNVRKHCFWLIFISPCT